jgi:hypothetical protein
MSYLEERPMAGLWGYIRTIVLVSLVSASLVGCQQAADARQQSEDRLTFTITCDMRQFCKPEYRDGKHFARAVQALADAGAGAFMISPGDIDPPGEVRAVLDSLLGDDYTWYPVVGNHESETPEDMDWLRNYNAGGNKLPKVVRTGPEGTAETTYSFDWGPAHVAVINQYYDGSSDIGSNGDVVDELYDWLAADLAASDKPYLYVAGHEPMVPVPDESSGRVRHADDSLNQHEENNARFMALLREYNAVYLCGHTHNASVAFINGVWQLDSGHARGIGDMGAPSTFMRVTMGDGAPKVELWRDDGSGGNYQLKSTWTLHGSGPAI